MNTIIDNTNKRSGRMVAGAIIALFGCVLLADQFDVVFIPDWLLTWPMILIAIGLYNGAKHNFQNLTWAILVFIGGAFLLDDVMPEWNIEDFVWPIGIIALGVYLVMRRGHRNLKY